MTWITRLTASAAIFVALSLPSWAVMLSNPGAPNPAQAELRPTIERGGTLDKLDLKKGTLVVDGVEFLLSETSVIVHAATGQANVKLTDLKPKMKIRFNTSKYNSSGKEKITEIWVANNIEAPNSRPEKTKNK